MTQEKESTPVSNSPQQPKHQPAHKHRPASHGQAEHGVPIIVPFPLPPAHQNPPIPPKSNGLVRLHPIVFLMFGRARPPPPKLPSSPISPPDFRPPEPRTTEPKRNQSCPTGAQPRQKIDRTSLSESSGRHPSPHSPRSSPALASPVARPTS